MAGTWFVCDEGFRYFRKNLFAWYHFANGALPDEFVFVIFAWIETAVSMRKQTAPNAFEDL
jgi:hypothetical protein